MIDADRYYCEVLDRGLWRNRWPNALIGLATEIVSAHVSNNAFAADPLPGLIQQVFNALAPSNK